MVFELVHHELPLMYDCVLNTPLKKMLVSQPHFIKLRHLNASGKKNIFWQQQHSNDK